MSVLLTQVTTGPLTGAQYAQFKTQVMQLRPSLIWLEEELRAAVQAGNVKVIERLLDVLNVNAYTGPERTSLTTLLSTLVQAEQFAGYVETLLEILSDFTIDAEVITRVGAICVAAQWDRQGYWPDLRKAIDLMYAAYIRGCCSKQQISHALQTILDSPNVVHEDIGMRELVIDLLRQIEGDE